MSASSPIVLVGSLDDIVFAGRNQEYGAFQLRRMYRRHLGSALAIALAVVSLLLLVPLAVRFFAPQVVTVPDLIDDLDKGVEVSIVTIEKPVLTRTAPHAAAAAPVTVRPHAEIATQIVKEAIPTFTPKPTELPQDNGPSTTANTGNNANPDGATRATASGKGGAGADTATPAAAAPAVYPTYVERMPEFAGGQEALRRYLQKHLRYPGPALANQIAGKVYLTFVVGADGAISEVTILKDLGYGTGEAAARAVRDMPAWTPGMQNHRSVPVRFTLPVTFQYE